MSRWRMSKRIIPRDFSPETEDDETALAHRGGRAKTSDRPRRRIRSRIIRLLAIGLALTTVSTSALGGANDQREISLLLSKLPGFRAHEMIQTDRDFHPNAPSPDGKWMADVHEVSSPGPQGVGTNPHHVRLWDRDGRFMKDVTQGIFYLSSDFAWSQTSDAMYVSIGPSYEKSSGIDPIWKLDLRHFRIIEPRLPYLPQTIDQELPVMSPSGDSYLLYDGLSRSIWRIWVRSGKRLRLAEGYYPQWSPDGQRILFRRSPRAGESEPWIMRADGRGARPLLSSRDLEKARIRHGWPKSINPIGITAIGFVAHRSLVLLSAAYQAKDRTGPAYSGIWLVDYERMRHEWLPTLEIQPLGMTRDGEHLFLMRESVLPSVYIRMDYEPTKKPKMHRKGGVE